MTRDDDLAQRFEARRGYLHRLALKIVGTHFEAEDAVQETWLRLSRNGAHEIENLDAWLTTVTARVCLDLLRGRTARREHALEIQFDLAEPTDGTSPETEAVLAESVAVALHVVLDGLTPAERVAFVLHDLFAVPFATVSDVLGRTPDATRMLASRARRRVRVEAGAGQQAGREVVEAFFAAARSGELEELVTLLAPDIVLRTDRLVVHGARQVASGAVTFARPDAVVHPAVVNGLPGVVVTVGGRPLTIMAFTVRDGRVAAIDGLSDQARLAKLVPSWIR
ncbi:sigma-70 family RNA polymerase sigma factor [Nocardioides sp. T2.26MG-1]|uniref:sigma-70 family RNA polymerase sigma factor n=1 Tax=Nocardioides sp. T2.26MG-1 TaxID=3041166 RepID=UPI00247745E5|nr:sigma-70 family RNA polymerase sigma factor [Nocardioides sp. T2.26MG-1]CAI9412712.1 ECF RNA polymerase sigma factor SigJ [Nocardioides sp. T2.26MG-1]